MLRPSRRVKINSIMSKNLLLCHSDVAAVGGLAALRKRRASCECIGSDRAVGIAVSAPEIRGAMHPQGGRLRAPSVADEASKKEWQRSKFEAAVSAANKFWAPQQEQPHS